MVDGFVALFTELDIVTWIVLAVSLACFVAEVFIPSFGLVGIGGIVLLAAGLGFACSKPWLGGSLIVWLIVDVLLIFGAVVGLVWLFHFLWKKKNGKVSKRKQQFIEMNGKKVPADSMGNPDFSYLKGKTGVCTTDLNPAGKAEIDGEIFDVHANKGYLYNGNLVRVVKTVGAIIYVEKVSS